MNALVEAAGDEKHRPMTHAVVSGFSVVERMLRQGKWGEYRMTPHRPPALL
jgi:hypothetical protein